MKQFSLAALLLPFATATGPFCGAGVSPLNANDFSSRAAMERDGWIFSGITSFKTGGVYEAALANGYSAANAFWGWGGGENVGSASVQMQVTGEVTLKYGRTHSTGSVKVRKNGVVFDTTAASLKTITFSVVAGDTIMLSEHDTSVMAIYSINVCHDDAAAGYKYHNGKQCTDTIVFAEWPSGPFSQCSGRDQCFAQAQALCGIKDSCLGVMYSIHYEPFGHPVQFCTDVSLSPQPYWDAAVWTGDPATVAPTVTPTTTPTGTPTTTPTGTPTTGEAFKQEQVDNDFAMSPWRTGRGTGDDSDTVYMCSDNCFKNEAGARDGLAYAGAEADQTVTLGNNAEFITSDGRFDVTPSGGLTFTESATGDQRFFPWDCTCGN